MGEANKSSLGNAVRELSRQVKEGEELRDGAFALTVLAHIADGMDIHKAFGPPGDWGYDTPIGQALAARAR